MFRKDPETDIGGKVHRFRTTRWSAIAALQKKESPERDLALDILVRMYWKPVYKYLRIKWRKTNEDAKDLTQAFFARAIEKDFFRNYDSSRARFRTFLRSCLDGFVANEDKASRAQKRGGTAVMLSLDFHQAEAELTHKTLSPDDCFEKEWVRNLFSLAIEEFRKHCNQTGHQIHFQLFEKYDLERDPDQKITYAELSSEFEIPVTAVTNYLAYARKEFRKFVLHNLREITADEREFRSEARRLFGMKTE